MEKTTKMKWRRSLLIAVAISAMVLPNTAIASDAGTPNLEVLKGLYPGKAFSPYAKRSFPGKVYWGETHLHTGLSLEAGVFGNTLGPEDGYQLVCGEEFMAKQNQRRVRICKKGGY